jgi:glycosyltransferase involved in cell wall biosynthesis
MIRARPSSSIADSVRAARGDQATRVLLDCTQTVATPRQSGIPRVVRNIARHGAAAAARWGATIVPVRYEEGHFLALDTAAVVDVAAEAGRPDPGIGCALLRRLHKLLVPKKARRALRAGWRRLLRVPPPDQAIAFGPGDTLLLADSSWAIRCWPAIDAARRVGTRVGVVQYDFIPHTHPELVPQRLVPSFRAWMNDTLRRADFVAAISETIAAEAREELRRLGRDPDRAAPLVRSFRLGADVAPPAAEDALRPALREFLAASPRGPYLTVGTVEPRKNQAILPAVFEQVWRQVPDARLLVAGFVGWQGEEFVRQVQRHPRYGSHLMHFGDLSDAELVHAYGRAREALAHGMRVLASDIPVHREVGGPWCAYFAPDDIAGLAARIIRWEQDEAFPAPEPVGDFHSPSWKQAVEQLMAVVFCVASDDARGDEHKRAA